MKLMLLLVVAMPLAAQFPLHLDLSGDWKFNEQDNPAFATPAFDDSGWPVFAIPRRSVPAFGPVSSQLVTK